MAKKEEKIEDIEKRSWQLLSLMLFLLVFFMFFALITIYQYTLILGLPYGKVYFYSFLILSVLFVGYVAETRSMLKKFRRKVLEERSVAEQFKEESIRESLLSFGAREHFEDCLAMQFKRAQASSTPFSIIVVEIKDLLETDKEFGYKTGNEIICAATKVFREFITGNNTVFRYTPETYVCIIPSIDEKGTKSLKYQIKEKLSKINVAGVGEIDFKVTTVSYPNDTSSLHELRKIALGSYIDENIG